MPRNSSPSSTRLDASEGAEPTTFNGRSFDARDWAREFVGLVRENPEIATDEGTMIGWFANALMRGYDEHAHRYSAAASDLRETGDDDLREAEAYIAAIHVPLLEHFGTTDPELLADVLADSAASRSREASPPSEQIAEVADGLGVRRCRGHWHVVERLDDGTEGEDLALKGDPFKSEADAIAAAKLYRNDPEVALATRPAGNEGER